jgi:PAB-dependent poly(A)-specific ribonuclease subunit 3
MATTRYQSNDLRRQVGSPRPKGRGSSARNLSTWRNGSSGVANVPDAQENKDTLCRNVLIYGNCRYEDQGCTFSHDQNKGKANQSQSDSSKKSLNVESPSFTPANIQPPSKKASLTSQAANAPAFTPKGLGASSPSIASVEAETPPTSFNPAKIREFTPTSSFDLNSSVSNES